MCYRRRTLPHRRHFVHVHIARKSSWLTRQLSSRFCLVLQVLQFRATDQYLIRPSASAPEWLFVCQQLRGRDWIAHCAITVRFGYLRRIPLQMQDVNGLQVAGYVGIIPIRSLLAQFLTIFSILILITVRPSSPRREHHVPPCR